VIVNIIVDIRYWKREVREECLSWMSWCVTVTTGIRDWIRLRLTGDTETIVVVVVAVIARLSPLSVTRHRRNKV